jgi:hypothetical protein
MAFCLASRHFLRRETPQHSSIQQRAPPRVETSDAMRMMVFLLLGSLKRRPMAAKASWTLCGIWGAGGGASCG